MGLQLYDLAGAEPERRFSPYCWRVKMALAHKGLPFDTIPWRFTDKDAIAFSGQGRVPVLIDGDQIVFDSAEWGLNDLPVGCELPISTAREWGLFISRAIREGESPEFSEPGMFLVRPNGTLFYAARSSAPWGRPPFDQMLRGIDIAAERKMPARGEA